jgi:hypothetical protein
MVPKPARYIPALSFAWLTPIYDPVKETGHVATGLGPLSLLQAARPLQR